MFLLFCLQIVEKVERDHSVFHFAAKRCFCFFRSFVVLWHWISVVVILTFWGIPVSFKAFQCCCCLDETRSMTKYNVVCLGITNAGKTTLMSVLLHENTDTIIPTVGFTIKEIRVGNVLLKVQDLGGGESYRSHWNRYYDDVQAVIFVIDGLCTHTELEDTRTELNKALENPQLSNIPWLILCNKQDLEGACKHQKVIEELQLHSRIEANPHIIVKSSSKTNRDELYLNLESFAEQITSFYVDQGDVRPNLQQV